MIRYFYSRPFLTGFILGLITATISKKKLKKIFSSRITIVRIDSPDIEVIKKDEEDDSENITSAHFNDYDNLSNIEN